MEVSVERACRCSRKQAPTGSSLARLSSAHPSRFPCSRGSTRSIRPWRRTPDGDRFLISGGDAPGKNGVLLGAPNRSGNEILAFAGGFDAPLAGEIDLVSALRGAG